MNEDSNEKPEEQQDGHVDSSVDLPDSAGNVADEQDKQSAPKGHDFLTVASRDSKIKRGTIVLAILFTVGLLCVLLMIKKSSPLSAVGQMTNEEFRIESAIAQLTGLKLGIGGQIDQIVRKFNQFSDVKKLQVEQLQKNPFVRDKYFPASGLSSEEAGSGAGTEALNSELARQAESMQLFSIMHSAEGNCCMIDDKLLYEGDKIGGFEVCRISQYTVELCTEGMKFVLRIPSEF